jgi:choline monooxygenase
MSPAPRFFVDPDIRRAQTLPAEFYRDAEVYRGLSERVLARSWQFVADVDRLRSPGQCLPVSLLPGCLDEPLVLTRDAQDALHCLSNVCTHRANVVVPGEGSFPQLRCRYHGRRFALDGHMLSMPEFEDALDFPRREDDLPRLALAHLGKLLFTSLDPAVDFDALMAPVRERAGFLLTDELVFDSTTSRDYLVPAHWVLYCENYLEGFHIPYVHASLASVLDYGAYRTELFSRVSLQVGIARDAEETFALPADSPDRAQAIAAYYFFVFPNLMLNFYPSGLSINVVVPLGPERTRVRFLSYTRDPVRFKSGAAAGLDRVEREDEQVVGEVQRGMRSRLYRRGRYSPSREAAVHHFHRLLVDSLDGAL